MSRRTLARAGAAAVLLFLSLAVSASGSPTATVPLLVLDRFEASFDQGSHTTNYKATVSSAEDRIVAFTWRLTYTAGRCGNFTVTGASNPQDLGSAQEATVPGLLNTDRYYISTAGYYHEGCTSAQERAQVLTLDIVRSDTPASCRLQYVQTARDGDSPPTPKEMPPTTKTGTCTIETPPPPPPPPPPPKLKAAPPIMTKQEKKQYLEYALVADGAAATTAGVSLALIEVPPAAAVALIVAGCELLLAEYYVYKAKDPPDPKYKVLAKPIVRKPRLLKPGNGVSPALAKAANAYLMNTAQMVGQDRAFIDSLERAQGAHAARNAVWDKRQSDLAAKYARAEARLLAARPALAAAIRRAAAPVLPRALAAADVNGVRRALPPALVSLLRSLGSKNIGSLRARVAKLSPASLTGSIAPRISSQAVAAAERGGSKLLRAIAARLAKRY